MVIHGPEHVEYDIDLGPVMLHDFYLRYYRDVIKEVLRPRPFPAAPPSDHNLMNGMGDITCSDSLGSRPCDSTEKLLKLNLTPGKTHMLRLINAGAEGMQRFSIDNHTLIVVTADFVPIEPYETKVLTLAVGQRANVLVKVRDEASDPVWMRSWISDICSFTNHHTSHGVVYFSSETRDVMPQTTGYPVDDANCDGVSPVSCGSGCSTDDRQGTSRRSSPSRASTCRQGTGNCGCHHVGKPPQCDWPVDLDDERLRRRS
jgi:hypothetical protein